MRPDLEHLLRILAAGILAPSAENQHYLRFQVLDSSVRLLATDCASWAELPHRQMLALLSYGAVLENIALRSEQLGYALTVALLPDPGRPEQIAELRWAPSSAPPDPLGQAIELRHTNRRFYRRASLPKQTLGMLSAAAAAVSGASLLWLDDAVHRPRALSAIRVAETERFRRRALHQELFSAVRFDVGWQQTCDQGLPPGALQVEPVMQPPFALLRRWPVMRAATWLGAHHALGFRAGYLPCALAPHIGLLLAGGPSEARVTVQAGRAFERVWLAAAAEGLALQPMAAATALARQRPGPGWVTPGVKARLNELLLGLCHGIDAQPYLLFRLGRAAAPDVVSGRSPLEHHIR